MVEFVVEAKFAGTTGTTGNGTDMTAFLFCVPIINSLDRVSLAVSSVVCLLLLGITAVAAAVTGLISGIEAPNLNPDSAGVEAIFADDDKSLSFDLLMGLAPNENVVAKGAERRSGEEREEIKFLLLDWSRVEIFRFSYLVDHFSSLCLCFGHRTRTSLLGRR